MKQSAINYINNWILRQASRIQYRVDSNAPGTQADVFNQSSELVIWNGASDNTIFNDPIVNYAFRAIHDKSHIDTGLGFNALHEIELGRIQASKIESDLLRELVYIEVSGQAEYYLINGVFIKDQRQFTLNRLKAVLQ